MARIALTAADAPVSVVMHGTCAIVAARRTARSSKNDSRPSGVLISIAMLPFTRGFYVNHVGTEAEEGTDRIRAAYGVSYQTLVALKNRYDPTNFFRVNQNIKPA